MNELKVFEHNGKYVADSRDIAKMIEKEHAHLMRDIKGYESILSENPNLDSQEFFIPSTYKVEGNNKTYPCYLCTKKGCDMVANKMTGEKGVLFTAAYIHQFYEMERKIARIPDFTNPAIAARAWADEYEAKQLAQAKVLALQPKADVYDAFADLEHTVGLRDFAKEVGIREGVLRKWLVGNGYVYMQAYTSKDKEKRRMKPTSDSVANGWMVMRDVKNTDGYTGTQLRFTMEGKKKLLAAMREQGICAL